MPHTNSFFSNTTGYTGEINLLDDLCREQIKMFGVDLLKNIRSIETWSRSSKDIDAVQPLVDEVNEVLQAVFVELRQDFNL